jgi:hypothetical protein
MAASGTQYLKVALDTYHVGQPAKCVLLTGETVAFGAAEFLSDLAADLSSVPAVAVAVSTVANTGVAPKRTEVHVGDATFPNVAVAVGTIHRVAWFADTGNAATSPVMLHSGLSEPVVPEDADIIVRQGSDGIVHAKVLVGGV